jgi:hypothetical protein
MSQRKKWRKGKYTVINWKAYNKDLKKRGDLTIWFTQEGIEKWIEEEEEGHRQVNEDKGIIQP